MNETPRQITADKLLQICWLTANEEAKHLGASEIEPIHFLLAVMKIIDPAFPEMLDKLNIESEEWAAMCKEAISIRHYIDVCPDRVTIKRRMLRTSLAKKQINRPISAAGMLHRSADMKRAFQDACMLAEGDTLTLLQLVESLFELELVSLSDVDVKA